MKRTIVQAMAAAAVAVPLISGCVAIPMGTEKYTTEYPSVIRATWDLPEKTYEPEPSVVAGDAENRTVAVGLRGTVVSEQAREQHYEKVTVEKRKRMAFGLFPGCAEPVFRPKQAMVPQGGMTYYGDGKYGNDGSRGSFAKASGSCMGGLLFLDTPVALLYGPFAPYEKSYHYMGRLIGSKRSGNTVNNTFSKEDVDALLKFPPADREKIGAWTYHENDRHPHNTFWNGFDQTALVGFDKYCYYLVHGPEKAEKKTPVAPAVTKAVRTVSGHYMVTLRLPTLGYEQTVALEAGEKEAVFNLEGAANGEATAEGTLRYAFGAEGPEGVRNSEDRALLEQAVKREWPVTVLLPVRGRRADSAQGPGGGTGQKGGSGAAYRIAGIGHGAEGEGLVVRVAVEDTTKTLAILRRVRPEIEQLVREDFAARHPDVPAEAVRTVIGQGTEEDGRILVYTGRAFAVQPTEDGWAYDEETRRGWVRMRVTGGMGADEAKRWARENISAIVAEKAGGGGAYRSLSEKYEKGVLTVEFSAEP